MSEKREEKCKPWKKNCKNSKIDGKTKSKRGKEKQCLKKKKKN